MTKKNFSWTDEHYEYIKKRIKGTQRKEMHRMFNERFGVNVRYPQFEGFLKRRNLKNGLDFRKKKGYIPWNKGMTGLQIGGKETQFKKGQPPINYRPVGSERTCPIDGYVYVKVEDPSTWQLKHVVEYEKHYGEVPKNHVVTFADGNNQNLNLDNLLLMTRSELAQMNKRSLMSSDPELTKTSLEMIRLDSKISAITLYGGDKEEFKRSQRKAKRNGISNVTFYARLKRGWPMYDAVNKPLNFRPKTKNRRKTNE